MVNEKSVALDSAVENTTPLAESSGANTLAIIRDRLLPELLSGEFTNS